MSEWTNELHLQFLEAYRNEPVLWDPTCPSRADKIKIKQAWSRLSETLQFPIEELKKKKESMMSTFRSHIRRKRESIRQGATLDNVYKPIWFAYEAMESFLGPIYNTTLELSYDSTDVNHENTTGFNLEKFSNPKQYSRDRSENRSKLQKTQRKMKAVLNTLNNALSDKEHLDESDLFAKLLAKKLRKLPESERELFMQEIDRMFLNRACRPPQLSSASNYQISTLHHPLNRPSSDGIDLDMQAGIELAKSAFRKDGFQVQLDVKHFKLNEITIKTIGNSVHIEAKHDDRQDGDGIISRHFLRKYILPSWCDSNKVVSSLSADGILTVKATLPQEEYSNNERIVEIQQEDPLYRL